MARAAAGATYGRTICLREAGLNRRRARNTENAGGFNCGGPTFVKCEARNAQRNFNLSLCRRLRDRRMSDMADLAGAMGFVMRVTIEMGHNLNA